MHDKVWYIAVGGQQQGPFSLAELTPRFQSGELRRDTYVFTAGMASWVAAGDRAEFTRPRRRRRPPRRPRRLRLRRPAPAATAPAPACAPAQPAYAAPPQPG